MSYAVNRCGFDADKRPCFICRKECGLDKFVPASLLDAMKAKDIRKMIGHYMKSNQNLAPSQKQITPLQVSDEYLRVPKDRKV